MLNTILAAGMLALAQPTPQSGAPVVTAVRLPEGRVQPSAAVGADGSLHIVCLAGEPGSSDVEYLRRGAAKNSFDPAFKVNSVPGSAVATGTIRGPQLALGRNGRVHIVWNGSTRSVDADRPAQSHPLLYTRLDLSTGVFEPERNLIGRTRSLDGGGVVAADAFGNVTIAWHAGDPDATGEGEADRRVFIAQSADDGKTFTPERPAADVQLGACGCCGMGAAADQCGRALLMYRAAQAGSGRHAVLLRSGCADKGIPTGPMRSTIVQEWPLSTCPMSNFALAADRDGSTLLAWETAGQVWLARCAAADGTVGEPIAPPGKGGSRKHPRVATNSRGQTLLVWTEGTGWKQGGSLAWQVFGADGLPIASASGRAEGIPVWGFAAAVALPDDRFEILY